MNVGSRVTKKHDKPRTPYQRALESPHVPEDRKEQLRKQYATLNPAALKRTNTKLQQKLLKIVSMKETLRKQHGDINQRNESLLGGYPR
jgi:hypothetical protein